MDFPQLHSVNEFLKNNEQLPENVMEDLQKGLEKPRQELAALEAEIKELEGRIDQLKIKRGQVEKYIAQYDCVLSPIRRLPADILHNIFYHCLPTKRDPVMNAKEAPILLSRICRAWRHTAYASPPLWARLYITFSDEDIFADNPESTKYPSYTLRLRCDAVEEWLSRSGALPLSISLCYSSRLWDATADLSPGKSDITLTLFRTLVQFSSRWQRLELKMPIDVYGIFEDMFLGSELPMLSHLRTSFFRPVDAHGILLVDGTPIALLQQRHLKRISLSPVPLQLNNVLSNPSLLTSLSCNRTISVTEAISILGICPNLAYVMLNLKQLPRSPPGHFPYPAEGRISLPHLRALGIVDSIFSDAMGSRIYGCIDAPQSEWVDYAKETTYLDVDPICDIAVAALLEKSTKLRKLTIQADGLDTPQLRKILRSAQSITHLVLGPEVRTDENVLTTTRYMHIRSHRWNLSDLFLQDDEGHQEEIGHDSGSALLPCLEILEISYGAAKGLSDKTLRDIILHREGLNISERTALLKKVVVLFPRAKEIDISAELSAHSLNAERVELKLEYRPQTPGPPYVHSRYGMDNFDRSWHFRDIEEEMMFS